MQDNKSSIFNQGRSQLSKDNNNLGRNSDIMWNFCPDCNMQAKGFHECQTNLISIQHNMYWEHKMV